MNELYEKICRYINWGKDTNVDTMKLNLIQDFTKEELFEAKKYAQGLINRLCEAETAIIEDCFVPRGDSVHDFLCHMVSKGEAFVDELCESRFRAVEIFEAGDYEENFFYVFPYEDEYDDDGNYKDTTARRYWKWVSEIKAQFREFLHNPDHESNVITCSPGWKPNISQENIKMMFEVLEEIWNLKWNSNRDYDTIYKATGDWGHGATVANLWSDFGKYYAKLHTECVIGDGEYRRCPDA
jgi:hypothetical protein